MLLFLLAEESVTQPVTVEITDCTNPNHFLKYRISLRSGTRFIVELDNTMPDCYLSTHIKPVFLTCVKPENNAYKFYKLEQLGQQVRDYLWKDGCSKRRVIWGT